MRTSRRDANIIFGASVDENMGQDVSVLATGFETGLMDALGDEVSAEGGMPHFGGEPAPAAPANPVAPAKKSGFLKRLGR